MSKIEWTTETIEILVGEDEESARLVEQEADVLGPFAVHVEEVIDGYAVTHVPTGRRMTGGPEKEMVRRIVERILDETGPEPWDRDIGSVDELGENVVEAVRRIIWDALTEADLLARDSAPKAPKP